MGSLLSVPDAPGPGDTLLEHLLGQVRLSRNGGGSRGIHVEDLRFREGEAGSLLAVFH